MKVTTKGRYGLKAIVDLAVQSKDGCPVTLKSISMRQGISENYLEQIIASLKKAGFVKSIRGAQGGYMLNKNPCEISVGDLLRVLEGPLVLVDCASDDENINCGSASCKSCTAKGVWKRMSDSIADVADSITLEELMKEEE